MRDRFRRFLAAYVRVVQKILITVLLTLVYVLVVGLTFLLAVPLKFRLLFPSRARRESYWEKARGYAVTPEEAERQS